MKLGKNQEFGERNGEKQRGWEREKRKGEGKGKQSQRLGLIKWMRRKWHYGERKKGKGRMGGRGGGKACAEGEGYRERDECGKGKGRVKKLKGEKEGCKSGINSQRNDLKDIKKESNINIP